jgi:hypothetical protein
MERTISAMQPIGDAASDLAEVSDLTHAEALGLLNTANGLGVFTLRGVTVRASGICQPE